MPSKTYERINQRNVDDPGEGTAQKNPLQSLASLGFALATLSCVVLAIVTYRINPPGEKAGAYDIDLDTFYALDCSHIQTIRADQFFTMRILHHSARTGEGPPVVSQFDQTFSIDIRTRAVLP
jgi:hypothetical protein